MWIFLLFRQHWMIVILIWVRVVNLVNPVTVMTATVAPIPMNCVLLQIVDGVADQRPYGLTILTILLFNRLIYVSKATESTIIGVMGVSAQCLRIHVLVDVSAVFLVWFALATVGLLSARGHIHLVMLIRLWMGIATRWVNVVAACGNWALDSLGVRWSSSLPSIRRLFSLFFSVLRIFWVFKTYLTGMFLPSWFASWCYLINLRMGGLSFGLVLLWIQF